MVPGLTAVQLLPDAGRAEESGVILEPLRGTATFSEGQARLAFWPSPLQAGSWGVNSLTSSAPSLLSLVISWRQPCWLETRAQGPHWRGPSRSVPAQRAGQRG